MTVRTYWAALRLRERSGPTLRFNRGAGCQVTSLPAGHDAWVVGDEDVVVIDWFGASEYAK